MRIRPASSEEFTVRLRRSDLATLRQMLAENGSRNLQSLLADIIETGIADYRAKQLTERERARLAAEHAAIPTYKPPVSIPHPKSDAWSKRRDLIHKLEDQRRRRTIELSQAGLSVRQVSTRLGVSRNTVRRWQKKAAR